MIRVLGVLVRALLLVAAVLLPGAWPPGWARPDLVLVVVAAVALLHLPRVGALTGLAGGWLLDLVPPGAEPLGAGALTCAALGLGLGLARPWLRASPLLPWLVTGLGVAAVLGVRWVTAAAGVGVVQPVDLLWTWVMTMLVAAALLPLLTGLERRLSSWGWA
ncbi:rod shape-determining protein MreD [Ornithinimicrobium sp. LYQ92]|uniref:rod shape-determining protein MreD n=1 Tax=Serinicoccus sp. LYQ92 TaxID=3378798 RepID=UPI0038536890